MLRPFQSQFPSQLSSSYRPRKNEKKFEEEILTDINDNDFRSATTILTEKVIFSYI